MASRYNGLPNTERMALVALKLRLELESLKNPDKIHTPEAMLREITQQAGLSRSGVCDEQVVLKAYYGGR